MHVRRALCLLLFVLAAGPRVASAQDAGKGGVTMGYPAAIGAIWNISANVGVRPEFAFTHNSVDAFLGVPSSSSWSASTGVSALFYTKRMDNLRPYVAPRFAYAHTSADDASAHSYDISGLVGAQYMLGSRFSVFGETGIVYSRGTATVNTTLQSLSGDRKTSAVGTTGGVGVIVYF